MKHGWNLELQILQICFAHHKCLYWWWLINQKIVTVVWQNKCWDNRVAKKTKNLTTLLSVDLKPQTGDQSHEDRWLIMTTHEDSWTIMICHEFSWILMITHDIIWTMMNGHDVIGMHALMVSFVIIVTSLTWAHHWDGFDKKDYSPHVSQACDSFGNFYYQNCWSWWRAIAKFYITTLVRQCLFIFPSYDAHVICQSYV